MGVYAAIISSVIGAGVKLLGSSQSPNYPSPPKLNKIDIAGTQAGMEDYEQRRMQSSIDAWKQKFPLLYQGGASEIQDIANNQAGKLSPVVTDALRSSGLGTISEGDQYHQAVDMGLSPITLAQRTSQAVNRQIALNPEWTNKISGGTLATMIANNYQNQNAFTQFLGANQTAQYVAGQQRSMYNTAALTTGLLGAAQTGTQAYLNSQNPLNSPLNPNSYKDSSGGYYGMSNYGATPYGGTQSPSPASNPYSGLSVPNYGNSYSSFGAQTPTVPLIFPPASQPTYGGAQSATDPYVNYF
jgi:hypothetical protein